VHSLAAVHESAYGIGSTFDTVYGDGHGTIAGAFAGLLAFTCARLWLAGEPRS
jgi:membrane-associated phospholipid phosphatase